MNLVKLHKWVLLAVIVLVAGGVVYWRQAGNGFDYLENYERLQREDTFGGQTPEETLNLFVAALEAGDVELASKYFLLDDQGSREKWVKRLQEIKDKGLMKQMASDIRNLAKADTKNILGENDFKFVLVDASGLVLGDIDLEFNQYSGVWKIESF